MTTPALSEMVAAENGGQPDKRKRKDHPRANIQHPGAPNSALEETESDISKMTCTRSYEPTCDMYSYVRFWNKRFNAADCFQSPGRHPLGKKAPVSEQKYVVFEPDRGGWNNIRSTFSHTLRPIDFNWSICNIDN